MHVKSFLAITSLFCRVFQKHLSERRNRGEKGVIFACYFSKIILSRNQHEKRAYFKFFSVVESAKQKCAQKREIALKILTKLFLQSKTKGELVVPNRDRLSVEDSHASSGRPPCVPTKTNVQTAENEDGLGYQGKRIGPV